MTPQEFFKKDLFAEQTGVELLEVREGYSKARLVITENHLNAGRRTQGGAIFTLADWHWPPLPIHMVHWLSPCLPISPFCAPADRVTHCMPKHANGTSDVLPDIIR